MTTFVLTCGISVLGPRGLGGVLGKEGVDALREAVAPAMTDLTVAARAVDPVRQAAETAREQRPSVFGLCVEVDSLLFARPAPHPAPPDPIVLLASDSPDGVLAAMAVSALCGRAARLRDAVGASTPTVDLALARTTEPTEPAAQPARPVDIVRVPGLLPKQDTLAEAMAHVARAVAWAGRLEPAGGDVVLHVAGGFKQTIPFMVALAEYLPDLLGDRRVAMYCLHETSEGLITRIPLRRSSFKQAVKELHDVVTDPGATPSPPTLEGWAWEASDGPVRLTLVGETLRALFDEVRRADRPGA